MPGLRILLVEDEVLVAMELAAMLVDMGCEVVGPVGQLADAISLARSAELEGAILDINLGGIEVYPVADELAARGIPFVFCTGYGEEVTKSDRYGEVFYVEKPWDPHRLQQAIKDLTKRVSSRGARARKP